MKKTIILFALGVVLIGVGIVLSMGMHTSDKGLSNEKFTRIMEKHGFKVSDQLDQIKEDGGSDLEKYKSSLSAGRHLESTIVANYTIYTSTAFAKEIMESQKKYLKATHKTKEGSNYETLYIRQKDGDNIYFFRVNNTILRFFYYDSSDIDKALSEEILSELDYLKYKEELE